MKRHGFKIKLASDRTIPLLVLISLFAIANGFDSSDKVSHPPSRCSRPARVGWQLDCSGLGDDAGALVFLDDQKLDLNRARAADLIRIERLSRPVAKAIVKRREELGRFTSFEELDEIHGVGAKTLERLRAHLKIEGG
jgi:competence ComEA-like helix-hairpin-helix protein